MSDMVGRVGQAIATALWNEQGIKWSMVKAEADIIACAAIEAMREPTEAMVRVGEDVDLAVDFNERGRSVGYAAREVYTAMIDAALNPSK